MRNETARGQPRVAGFADSNGDIHALLYQVDVAFAQAQLDRPFRMLSAKRRQCGREDVHADGQRRGHLERSGRLRARGGDALLDTFRLAQ
jgi:hypothetical protein